MNSAWQTSHRKCPDPYLDWELRTRPESERRKRHWCPLHIQVLPGPDGNYLPNLRKLRRAVMTGRLDGDPANIKETIRMADDERRHLEDVIAGMKDHRRRRRVDPIQVQFFIYRRESLIYRSGAYARTSVYDSLQAGPPIAGLDLNKKKRESRPLMFSIPPTVTAPVAIGIIDDGIAFAHERFRNRDGSTRIHAIWVQEMEREEAKFQDGGVFFGYRFQKKAIDLLLKENKRDARIYEKLGITDFYAKDYNPLAHRAAHGTHVLDLAAGRAPSSAGDAQPILAVQLPSVATIDTSGMTMGSYVLQAVRTIMVWADVLDHGRPVPLVINFSYGLTAGPKDGTQYLERTLHELVAHRNRHVPTRLVMPAGNSYRARAAARLIIDRAETKTLDWVVLPDDGAPNFVEIWLDGSTDADASSVEVALTPPGHDPCLPVRLERRTMQALMVNGRAIAGMYYDYDPSKTSRARIFLATGPSTRNDQGLALAPSGRWKISLSNVGDCPVLAHYFVQRNDTPFGYPRRGRQSHLEHPGAYERDPETGDYREQGQGCPIIYEDTLSAIATYPTSQPGHTFVVGAAIATDHHPTTTPTTYYPPTDYTSSGPTLLRAGPDCAAVADDGDAHWGVLAAGTLSGSVVRMSGTSVAAPQVARQVADTLGRAGNGHTMPVSTDDQPRLGHYVLEPAVDDMIPTRRYPVIPPKRRRS